jgi:hypothetical protein
VNTFKVLAQGMDDETAYADPVPSIRYHTITADVVNIAPTGQLVFFNLKKVSELRQPKQQGDVMDIVMIFAPGAYISCKKVSSSESILS